GAADTGDLDRLAGEAEEARAAADEVVLAKPAEDRVVPAVALDVVVAVARAVDRRVEDLVAHALADERVRRVTDRGLPVDAYAPERGVGGRVGRVARARAVAVGDEPV